MQIFSHIFYLSFIAIRMREVPYQSIDLMHGINYPCFLLLFLFCPTLNDLHARALLTLQLKNKLLVIALAGHVQPLCGKLSNIQTFIEVFCHDNIAVLSCDVPKNVISSLLIAMGYFITICRQGNISVPPLVTTT